MFEPSPAARLTKACPECGAGFACGPDPVTGNCWCDELPAILPPKTGSECLCPDCLKAKLARKISQFIALLPPESRRNGIATRYAKPGAPLVEGLDYYAENGLLVFTEWYHLKRGECCDNGCRHCPYRG